MLSSAGLIRSRPRATPPAIHIFGRPIFYSPKIRLLITLLSRCYRGAGHFLGCTQEEKRSRPSCLFFSSCPHLPLFIMGVARLAAWSGLDCLNLVKLLLLPALLPRPCTQKLSNSRLWLLRPTCCPWRKAWNKSVLDARLLDLNFDVKNIDQGRPGVRLPRWSGDTVGVEENPAASSLWLRL